MAGSGPLRHAGWLLSAALVGCAGPQTVLDPAGAQSGELLSLLTVMLWVCGAAYLAVLVFLGGSIWRARRVIETERDPESGDRALTQGLWVWGALVAVGILVLAGTSFVIDGRLAKLGQASALDVRVTGHQWWWRIEYRDPGTGAWVETANELHLPLGRSTRLELGSADVIHSFWVPNVAGKMDLVPGRTNVVTLTPRRPGWFRGQCAEFCGAQHANMAFDVKIDTPAEFGAWLARQRRAAAAPADTILARGATIVAQGTCAACHRVRGTAAAARAGPDLTHLASRRSLAAGTLPMTRGAVQGWIAQPRALKPGTMMPPTALTAADADALSRYLMSLQ